MYNAHNNGVITHSYTTRFTKIKIVILIIKILLFGIQC